MTTRFGLGARLHKDPRSRAYPHPVKATAPQTVTWAHYGAVLDQGQVGSCTGNGPVQLLNSAPWHKPWTPYLDEHAARVWYGENTRNDPFPGEWLPDDTGSSLTAAMNTGRRRGHWPSYSWVFTGAQGVAEALQTGPVVLATTWLDQMFYPDDHGVLSISGSEAGGHCYLLNRVNVRSRMFGIINSWGSGWGLSGRAWIPWQGLDHLLLDLQGEAALPIRPVS